MFDLLFKSLSDLNTQTSLLEACGWDEQRLAYVIESFKSVCNSSFNQPSNKMTIDEIKKEIQKNLRDSLNESEILILSNILDSVYRDMLESKQENQYEN